MKNILLIGGAGYVGSVITSHFLKLGFKVRVLDNFVYCNQYSISPFIGDPNYEIFYGNFGDNKVLSNASKGMDNVVILGGLVGDPITKKYPNESEIINEKSIKSCIDFFDNKHINKIIFISTCSNYGLIKENELADENFELKPLSLYAKAKVSAEKHLLSKKGLEITKKNSDYYVDSFEFQWAFCRFFWESHVLLPEIKTTTLENWNMALVN